MLGRQVWGDRSEATCAETRNRSFFWGGLMGVKIAKGKLQKKNYQEITLSAPWPHL